MARKSKADASAVESLNLDAVVQDDDLVEVRWHDGSSFTFDLHFAGRRIPFVNGAAHVAPDVAARLREGGYVE